VTEQGLSVPETARRLAFPKSTISHRVRASKDGSLENTGKNRRELSDVELELAKLRHELARVKMERNILKKSSGIFHAGVDMKYATINELRLQYSITYHSDPSEKNYELKLAIIACCLCYLWLVSLNINFNFTLILYDLLLRQCMVSH